MKPRLTFPRKLNQMTNLEKIDIQFGRIPIAWGTGYAFNPTAKTHPVSFLDDLSEETPGTGFYPATPLTSPPSSFIWPLKIDAYPKTRGRRVGPYSTASKYRKFGAPSISFS